jgi:hypothetical protein
VTFDLTSSFTPIDVQGKPGRHGWRVIFHHADMTPFVVDSSMVDAHEFMRVLYYYRPSLGTVPLS